MIIKKEQDIDFLRKNKSQNIVKGLIYSAENSNLDILHMTANENIISQTASEAMHSSLSNRYHIGTSENYDFTGIAQKGSLFFRGLPDVYQLEAMAHDALNRNLGGEASDSRMLSGMHAMICTISSLTAVGDIIVSINPIGGGHFATGNLVRQLGRKSVFVDHNPDTLQLSLSHLVQVHKKHTIKMIILDDSSPLFIMPFKKIREILGKDVLIVYDASHTMGLIFGKVMENPLDYGVDILQGNTHKTFPGPQKGIIHYAKKELFEKAQEIIGNALVSSQHTHHSMALYVTILEMDIFAEKYAKAMIENAKVLADELVISGLELLNNGYTYTQTNQVLIKVPNYMSNKEAFEKMLKAGISINVKNVFEKDVIRIGVQELTRRGMKTKEMKTLARIVSNILLNKSDVTEEVQKVRAIHKKYNKVLFSFDDI